jgi:Arc/MetJ family transcription regulator
MRTTLNLDNKLLADLMRVTDAKTKTDAIQEAMAALIRRKKLDKLRSLSGKIRLRTNREAQEKSELRRQARLKARWHGHR